jgi:hypothetical protein
MKGLRERWARTERLDQDRNQQAESALGQTIISRSAHVSFLERLLLHYKVYRNYPLRPWPAFKNACRIAFR